MIRIVIDTNIFVRYLIRPSAAIKELLEVRWLSDQVQVVTAPELVAELTEVLQRPKILAYIQPQEAQVISETIRRKAELLPPLGTVPPYTRDPKDDKFVACAIIGNAQYLVSVDEDILVLQQVGSVQMVTPFTLLPLLDQTVGFN
ncbi:MAG: putative toxin-antitoxin system toxin component, PIN family [Caldilineaceae bacterium]